MSLLIELLRHKQKSTKNKVSKRMKNFYNVKCAITDICHVHLSFYCLLTLLIKTLKPL